MIKRKTGYHKLLNLKRKMNEQDSLEASGQDPAHALRMDPVFSFFLFGS